MNRDFVSFPISDFNELKQQMLNWVNQFNICCFLDNHQYDSSHHQYECLAGAGAIHFIEANAGNAISQLQEFRRQHPGWLFGHLGYDLKNETESLQSNNIDRLQFPHLFFFVPEIILRLNENKLAICSNGNLTAQQIFTAINNTASTSKSTISPSIKNRFSRNDYIETIKKLQEHIHRGDCYEINFCQEFYAEHAVIDAMHVYNLLSTASPNPFSAYYKINDKYLLCASPERYLRKTGNTIISQPMKGTWKRDTANVHTDEYNKQLLFQSKKNRSENVMIVDLVRNDLSRICKEGTVKVEELFGVYTFPQVHQMVSTISGELNDNISFSEIIHATFPMGSMTGAPKKKVLELIEQYEKTQRGIFSGALGYINPDDDFDFNVVIRSILYNSTYQYLSYLVGSGITFYSDATEEYEECMLKATAIEKVLAPPTPS